MRSRFVPPSSLARILLLGVPFGLAAVLLFYAVRGVEWRMVWQVVAGASPIRLGLAVMLGSTALLLRACRWRILLNAAAEGTMTVSGAFWATAAGYFGNIVLPARAGELVRTLVISSRYRLEPAFVLATALAERMVDALALVFIGAAVLLALRTTPGWLAVAARPMAILALFGALAIVVLPRVGPQIRAVMERVAMPPWLLARATGVLDQGLRGLATLHAPSRLVPFLGLTGVIWTLDAMATMVTGSALGLRVTMPVAFLLIAGLGLGSALPSTPGYVGIYQFVAVTVLTPFGFTAADAIAFVLVAQAMQLVVIGLWGSAGLWRYRLSRRAA
jgi:uncharacterized protein (TIRG00374 family)